VTPARRLGSERARPKPTTDIVSPETIIEKTMAVRKNSFVYQWMLEKISAHSGCVKTWTRSETFHVRP
jgi:hypothetical protein